MGVVFFGGVVVVLGGLGFLWGGGMCMSTCVHSLVYVW